jgi:flagellar FliL protein
MAYLETSYSEKKGPWKILAVFLLLTLLAAGTGGLLGMHILDVAERMVEEQRAQPKIPTRTSKYTGTGKLLRLQPIVTNLAAPQGVFARIEASLVTDRLNDDEAIVMAARIGEDLVAFLRTTSLAQIEGGAGMQHLREDLNERVVTRSSGKVREIIIETLVVQ